MRPLLTTERMIFWAGCIAVGVILALIVVFT